MKRAAGSVAAVLLGALALTVAGCGEKNKVAAKVNNATITEDEFNQRVRNVDAVELLPALRGQGLPQAGEFAMLHLITDKLTEQLGAEKGIKPTDAQVNAYIAYAKKYQSNPMYTLLPQDPFRTDDDWKNDARIALIYRGLAMAPLKITQADIQKTYDQLKPQLATQDQYHLRLIDVHSAANAKQAEEALSKGLSFETVALKYSEEPNSKARQGDVGTLPSGQLPPALLAAVKDLKAGEYTKHAVQMQVPTPTGSGAAPAAQGPHFILAQLVEKLPGRIPTLEEAHFLVEIYLLNQKDPSFVQRLQGDMTDFRKKSMPNIQINLKGYEKLMDKLSQPSAAAPGGAAGGAPTSAAPGAMTAPGGAGAGRP